MTSCCQRFEQAVAAGDVVRAAAGEESAWRIPELWHLCFCPFCGAEIRYSLEAVADAPDTNTLAGLLQRIGEAAYFSGIEVRGPNSLGLFATTPLHIAALWGDCAAIRMLVEAGAELDARGEHDFTPLMEAVAQGNREAVELLVEPGAAPLENDEGDSPSAFAALLGNDELAAYLRSRGC